MNSLFFQSSGFLIGFLSGGAFLSTLAGISVMGKQIAIGLFIVFVILQIVGWIGDDAIAEKLKIQTSTLWVILLLSLLCVLGGGLL